MATEQYLEEDDVAADEFGRVEKWKSTGGSNDSSRSGGFDCNICLESVQDPVVTLCGHLYCWPCIYKWLNYQSVLTDDEDQKQQQCPVCKAEVSSDTIIPLYGRSQSARSSDSKAPHLGVVIPRRPLPRVCEVDSPRTLGSTMSPRRTPQPYQHNNPQYAPRYYSRAAALPSQSGTTTTAYDAMFGEMVYARIFGNSITNSYTYPNTYSLAEISSPRIRSQIKKIDKSLNRICFFLLLCTMLCLLLF